MADEVVGSSSPLYPKLLRDIVIPLSRSRSEQPIQAGPILQVFTMQNAENPTRLHGPGQRRSLRRLANIGVPRVPLEVQAVPEAEMLGQPAAQTPPVAVQANMGVRRRSPPSETGATGVGSIDLLSSSTGGIDIGDDDGHSMRRAAGTDERHVEVSGVAVSLSRNDGHNGSLDLTHQWVAALPASWVTTSDDTRATGFPTTYGTEAAPSLVTGRVSLAESTPSDDGLSDGGVSLRGRSDGGVDLSEHR